MGTEERSAVGSRMPAHRGTRIQKREPKVPAATEEKPVVTEAPVLVEEEHKEEPAAPELVNNRPQDTGTKKHTGALEKLKAKTKYAFSLKTDTSVERPASQPKNAKKKGSAGKRFRRFVKTRKLLSSILATVILILLVIIIAAAVPARHKEETPDTSDYMDRIRNQEIRINDVTAVDAFFTAYYTALSSGNTTALETMYDDPSQVNITTEISTIVNQYDNFTVYVTRGIDENEYIAFVYNDIHFANIEATAPSVDSFYLRYDPEAAALKICSDMYTNPDKLKFMNLVSYRDPIRQLLADTNEKLSDALASNTDLNNLYIIMQSMAETESEE